MGTFPFSLSKEGLLPREEMLEIKRDANRLIIGVPRETSPGETRIPLTPEGVQMLVREGHRVLVESSAGSGAQYSDLQYSDMGAEILERTEVYQSDIILKVTSPNEEELKLFKEGQVLLSSLSVYNISEGYIRELMAKKITAILYEGIKDSFGIFPVMRNMGEISGRAAILVAGSYLSRISGGKGVLLGGISGIQPSEVVILGADIVGESAARAAIGLGAFVRVFDHSVYALEKIQQHLGMSLYTSVMHPQTLQRALQSADVVIAAISSGDDSPFLVTEEMVSCMKPGSVVVDTNMSQGGCFETSKCGDLFHPMVTCKGVIHYCIPHIAAITPRTASMAFSNVLSTIIRDISNAGGIRQKIKADQGLRHGVYMLNGILVNDSIGNRLGLPWRDIELLMAAF